jgi:hypothetical protein
MPVRRKLGRTADDYEGCAGHCHREAEHDRDPASPGGGSRHERVGGLVRRLSFGRFLGATRSEQRCPAPRAGGDVVLADPVASETDVVGHRSDSESAEAERVMRLIPLAGSGNETPIQLRRLSIEPMLFRMSLGFEPPTGPSEIRAAGGQAARVEEVARADSERKSHEAVEELRASGRVKRPWYQRLWRRSHTA